MLPKQYYLQLPASAVPDVLFEMTVHARRVSVVFESESGHVYRVAANDDPAVRLCCLNRSLEEISAQFNDLISECLSVRGEIAEIARCLGLEEEIPTAANRNSWAKLAMGIHNQLHGLDDIVKWMTKGSKPTGGD